MEVACCSHPFIEGFPLLIQSMPNNAVLNLILDFNRARAALSQKLIDLLLPYHLCSIQGFHRFRTALR